MAELTNPQHEEFTQLLAAGTPPPDAYAQAHPGVSKKTAQSEAERLTQTAEIEQRLTELLEGGAEEAIWTLSQRLEYLRAIALTPPSEIDAQSPICLRVKHTAHGVEYRLPNKLAAVALYEKLAGDSESGAGPERDFMAEMIGAIRSGTWKKQAAEKKEARALRVLDDVGEERFAQLVGSGERPAYSYQKVYDAPRSTALVEGHHLAREPHVAKRIAEIRQAGSAEAGWTRTMRMRYLREFAATPIGEIDLNSQFCQGVRRTLHGEEFLTPDKLKAVALYSTLAKIQKEKKSQTIEEAIKGMRARGNERAAHGTENSLIHYVYDMVG